MSSEYVPSQKNASPVYVPVVSRGTSFGSIVTAMVIGALLAVSGLYMWGAEIAKQQTASPVSVEQQP